ncbi:MAG: glutamate racemase [Ignavibacteria bacterium]|nr:glutamate racemase [Ignavibacteria bacterium]
MHDKSFLPIGVFDSGIGGLTVVHSLLNILPHENIIYFGDTARVPYGPKSPETVRCYAKQDAQFLVSQKVKIIVVACNTVSAVALDVVQKEANVPVVGVIIPGAKSAVHSTKKKRIGVIGTKATIASNAYTNAIRQLDDSIKVFGKSCPLFVPLAEEGFTEHKATEMLAKEYLFSFKQDKIDTLVLGCTHYPLLKNVIQNVLEDVTLIDSGVATAESVKLLLEEKGLRNTSKHKPNILFFVSDVPEKFSEVGERFLGMKMGKVRRAEGVF